LEVDRNDLIRLIRQDSRIDDAQIEIVAPGDAVRVTGIRDVVEPRVKFGGEAQVFPGVLGPVAPVGDGVTHRLSGMAVLATAAYEGTIRAGTGVQRSAMLDMSDPGAETSRFSTLRHLVLILRIRAGLGELEAHGAIQKAAYEAARRIADTTRDVTPARTEVYDLNGAAAQRPKVVLIQGCITQAQQPHSGVSYYGLPIRESLPTALHPNELLDGAVTMNTTRGIGYYPTTWDWQNHPLLLGLYRQHAAGSLALAGVILERISYETHHAKEVVAHNAAQLAAAASEPVDYVALGPMFGTISKRNPDPVVGVEKLREWRSLAPQPLVAIGGITRANARQALDAGADSIAVIGDLFPESGTIRARSQEWMRVTSPGGP
jgi:glycine reductase